jgi:hypothetical protein
MNAMLRAQLMKLKRRYDCYAFSPAIYAVVRNLEIEISWIEHGRGARSPRYPTLPIGSRVSPTAQGEVNGKLKNVDPLPLLLEAAHRALRERLAREPFGDPEIESKVANMSDEMSYVRARALTNQIKNRGRGSLDARL